MPQLGVYATTFMMTFRFSSARLSCDARLLEKFETIVLLAGGQRSDTLAAFSKQRQFTKL